MKKVKRIALLLLTILSLSTCSLFASAAHSFNSGYQVGQVINEAVYSDITANINLNNIQSYNINGNTAICVEDLSEYAFDVKWDGVKKILYLGRRDEYKYVRNQFVYSPSDEEVGQIAYDVLYSDIKTYVMGSLVESFNINGQTMIYIDALAPYGNLDWDSDSRIISLRTPEEYEIKKLYYSTGELSYYGQVKDGKKQGFGLLYNKDGVIYYSGGFYDDKLEGYGVYTFKDGWSYRGEWVNDYEEGFGIVLDQNRNLRYVGDFKDGDFHGYGTAYDEDENVYYQGYWANGEYDGYGKTYDTRGNLTYEGYFSKGVRVNK